MIGMFIQEVITEENSPETVNSLMKIICSFTIAIDEASQSDGHSLLKEMT